MEFLQFAALAATYRYIPLEREYSADTLTPMKICQIFGQDVHYCLESADHESEWSNYSVIGLDALCTIEERNGRYVVGARDYPSFTAAYTAVKAELQPYVPNNGRPFNGGAVGYVAYDIMPHIERTVAPIEAHDEAKLHVVVCQTQMTIHHRTNSLTVTRFIRVTDEELRAQYEAALTAIDAVMERLTETASPASVLPKAVKRDVDWTAVTSNMTKQRFLENVERVKQYIRSGDVFQCVLSQQFTVPTTSSALDLYRTLRQVNPSPYMFFLQYKTFQLIGSSPERLVAVAGEHLEIHPIAGTRKRGANEAEDERIANELRANEKECAEHVMLVDLARNDLGRVAVPGSVAVSDYMTITKFSAVMHMISKVVAQRQATIDPLTALMAAFPAGTVSGAPKVRAMQIIAELEPTARRTYAGAICYLGFDDVLESCITIRTIRLENGVATVQAGAGIVADSDPEAEYEETRSKASAMIATVQVVNDQRKERDRDVAPTH